MTDRPTPKYAPIADWCAISGMGRTKVYEEAGRGNLKLVKLGGRTLVDVEHGLKWLGTLPAATIRTGQGGSRTA